MIRVRLTYAKRGRGCFIPHIAMPQLLYRSGRRAGLVFALTEGFTPRPRISLGPELPVGVVALAEPADMWVDSWNDDFLYRWNSCIPEAFTITGAQIYEGPSLSKSCDASGYLLSFRSPLNFDRFVDDVEEGIFLPQKIMHSSRDGAFLKLVLGSPFAFGAGSLVKRIVEADYVKGWPDVHLVRTAVGVWNGTDVDPVVPQGDVI